MEHDNFLGGAFNKETGELNNTDKLREHFKSLKDIEAEEKIIHMAYLCILESYPRIEKRESY
ncbi:hypothetical protein ECC06_03880 [Helicobacter pylori]|uniref:hypothetical protein n=1 Tax=Helicobacter pylori TaxID=210 RepID=UPI000FDEDF0D|nr:hypothetical protein [Helicobacter pylori]RVY19314.1 hypothetical protein ECC06_03880 [Helicobacter pylori]